MLIAQISDTHIRPENVLYQGVADSNAMFSAALAHLNALDPRPDLVLLSGDVVDAGTPAEYAHARRLLAALEIPLLVIPGNHDERAAFRAAFHDHAYLPAQGPLHYIAGGHGPVRIVALDVTLPGRHHGAADAAALAWLDQALAREPARPTIVMMHQPPFACGIAYMDKYWCEGGEALAALLRRYPAVERLVCGHVHRSMQLRFGGTVLCTAPSTTTAIALRLQPEAAPASYMEPPACLLHHWTPATGIVTHVSFIGAFAGPYSFA
jgi:3',5'-cyclic-AMP phosphodiesterase